MPEVTDEEAWLVLRKKELVLTERMCTDAGIKPIVFTLTGRQLLLVNGFTYHQGLDADNGTIALAANNLPGALLDDERFFEELILHLQRLQMLQKDKAMQERLGHLASILNFTSHDFACQIMQRVRDDSGLSKHHQKALEVQELLHSEEVIALFTSANDACAEEGFEMCTHAREEQ